MAELTVGSEALDSAPCTSSGKRDAEQAAAGDLLALLRKRPPAPASPPPSPAPGPPERNFIGEVNEWCQKHHVRKPSYDVRKGSGSASSLQATLTVRRTDGSTAQASGAGATAQAARQRAAEQVLAQLVAAPAAEGPGPTSR